MTTLEERVARLEGARDNVATKDDVAGVRADMATKDDVERLHGRIDRLFLAVLGIGGGLLAAAISAATVLGVALLG